MVTSSGTSPNALDILSHVNLSHGIPADVSVSAPSDEQEWLENELVQILLALEEHGFQ